MEYTLKGHWVLNSHGDRCPGEAQLRRRADGECQVMTDAGWYDVVVQQDFDNPATAAVVGERDDGCFVADLEAFEQAGIPVEMHPNCAPVGFV